MSDRKSRQALRKVKDKNKDAIIVATGCYAQSSKEELEKMPEIDVVLGNEEKRDNEKGKAPEKEPDLNVFRQIFKMAKKRNVNKVVIGDDLSQEAREKATVAAVTEDMKVDGKGKTKEVDLKKDYVKKLPPAIRRKVRNYNVSNLTPEERKKYREKRKILRMSGRIKPKKPEKEIKPENSFVNEKAAELQASVTGKMMPQDMSGFGRE